MKRLTAIFVLATAPLLHAQEAAPVNPGRLQVAPAQTPAEPALIPEIIPQTEKPKPEASPKSEKKSKTEEDSEALLARIHFREARTKALRDPEVQAQWSRSLKAKTDYERREALKSYYKALYARILKIDSSVKKVSDERQTAALHRLEQTRIDPTEPLDPVERAERFDQSQ